MRLRPVALAVLLVLITTWPILTRIGHAVPGEKFTSAYGVYRNALLHPPWTWLDIPFELANFPEGGRGVLVAIPQFLLAGGLAPLLGETAAINVSLLIHLVAGVLAAGALARRVAPEAGEVAAAFAGVVLGVGSFALGTWATGQPENVGVVYVLLAVERGLAWLGGGRRGAALTCLGTVGLAFLSSPYLVMGPLLAAPIVAFIAWDRYGARRVAALLAGVALVTVTVASPYRRALGAREEGQVLCPASLSREVPERSGFDLSRSDWAELLTPPPFPDPNVADPVTLLLPVNLSGVKQEVSIVYLGIVPLMLAAWALVRAPWRVAWLWSAAMLPLVLSLGPRLRLGGWVLLDGGEDLWLPLAWLQDVPGLGSIFQTIQMPARLALGVALPLGMAAVIGLGLLPRRLAVGIVGLALAEGLLVAPARPPAALFPVVPPDAYLWLAGQPDHDAVLDAPPLGFTRSPPFPAPITWTRSLFGRAAFHHHPVPYTGCFPPLFNARILASDLTAALERVVAGEVEVPLGPGGAALRSLGVGWIVWHPHAGVAPEEVEARVETALTAAFPRVFQGDDGSAVYRLPDP